MSLDKKIHNHLDELDKIEQNLKDDIDKKNENIVKFNLDGITIISNEEDIN